jgi:hypothetical protein
MQPITNADGTRRVRRNGIAAAGWDRVNGIHTIIRADGPAPNTSRVARFSGSKLTAIRVPRNLS